MIKVKIPLPTIAMADTQSAKRTARIEMSTAKRTAKSAMATGNAIGAAKIPSTPNQTAEMPLRMRGLPSSRFRMAASARMVAASCLGFPSRAIISSALS